MKAKFKSSIFILGFILTAFLICTVFCSCRQDDYSFKYWTDDAKAIVALKDFVKQAQDPNSKNYIPASDRIAIFDMDGTLSCEKFPTYFEWLMFAHRVLDDPDYKDKASAEEINIAKQIRAIKQNDKIPENLEKDEAVVGGKAFAGMSVSQYYNYVLDFMKTDAEGFVNMQRGQAFYLPMKEVVEYLAKNEFSIYICSGTDRILVRTLLADVIKDIPSTHVIGMDYELRGENQGDIDGLDYVYKKDEKIIRTSELKLKNVKMNKVVNIMEEISQYPCLAFGNSSGDESMLRFTTDNPNFNSMAFIIKNDDTDREYGNEQSAEKIQALADKNGWQSISMKDDWKTIYDYDVKKDNSQ